MKFCRISLFFLDFSHGWSRTQLSLPIWICSHTSMCFIDPSKIVWPLPLLLFSSSLCTALGPLYPEVTNYNKNHGLTEVAIVTTHNIYHVSQEITLTRSHHLYCHCQVTLSLPLPGSVSHGKQSFILEMTLSLGSKNWGWRLGQSLLCCVSLARIIRLFFFHHAMRIIT